MSLQGSLSIERMCQLAQVSRAGFYRSLQERLPVEEELEVRSTIQQIVLEHRRRYGYRRVTAELRRRGLIVNHKRVARLMREDNLLAVQPRAFVVTTDSKHEFEVYLNLAKRMKLTGINQLWVADITYIRLQSEFVYLPNQAMNLCGSTCAMKCSFYLGLQLLKYFASISLRYHKDNHHWS